MLSNSSARARKTRFAVLLGKSPRAIYEGVLEAGRPEGQSGCDRRRRAGLRRRTCCCDRPDLVRPSDAHRREPPRRRGARGLLPVSLTGYLGSERWRCPICLPGRRDLAGRVAAGQPIYAGGRIDAQLQAA